jgi:hypothetical protein
MKNKTANLKDAIVAVLGSVGLPETDVKVQNYKIEVPSYGVTITSTLHDGKRVWKAEATTSVLRLEDSFESSITNTLFLVPHDDDLMLARKLGIHLALQRIDAAIDAIA